MNFKSFLLIRLNKFLEVYKWHEHIISLETGK